MAGCALTGTTHKTSDRKKLKTRVLLTVYVAHILESEDLLSVQRKNQTAFPF